MKGLIEAPIRLLKSVVDYIRGHRAYSTLVLLPCFLFAIYYGFISTDRYVSDASVLVQNGSASTAPSIALNVLGLGGGNALQDALLIQRFIESPAMLDYLEGEVQLREHYSSDASDWFSRMSPTASKEDFLAFYLDRVTTEINEESMTIELAVQGSSREYAQKVASAIVKRSEQFVNEVSQALAREQIDFAQRELESVYERLKKASADVIDIQDKRNMFSAEVENETLTRIIGSLQGDLARERTTLKALTTYLSESAAEVVATKTKIAALERQIAQERDKQVGGLEDKKMNQQMLDFQEVKLNQQIAADIYQTGVRTLETARIDATRKVKFLVLISPPTMPDKSTEPESLYNVATIFIVLNLLYAIGGLIIATIRDHQE